MTKVMDEDFLDVLQDKGPALIISINGNPPSVANTRAARPLRPPV